MEIIFYLRSRITTPSEIMATNNHTRDALISIAAVALCTVHCRPP